MEIKLNGEGHVLSDSGKTLVQLLDELGLKPDAPGIAIAVNWEVIPKSEWDSTPLSEGDEVELITARQGG